MKEIIIRSEDEAWALLERAAAGESFDDVAVKFDGWPNLTYDFKGRDWNSTVPTRVMRPLLEVQKDINRAYVHAKYGDPNLHKLKDDDKDALEVVVKVREGSSLYDAELWKQINYIAQAAFGNMTGTQSVFVVLGIALAVVSPIMYRMWTNRRLAEKGLDIQVELSKQETARLALFAQVSQREPVVRAAQEDAEASQNRLLKVVRPDDKLTVHDVQITGGEAADITSAERDTAVDAYLEGDFHVIGNKTDLPDGFRIEIQRRTDGLKLRADVSNALPFDQINLIKDAEWDKTAVNLRLNASMLRSHYVRASVSSARKPGANDTSG